MQSRILRTLLAVSLLTLEFSSSLPTKAHGKHAAYRVDHKTRADREEAHKSGICEAEITNKLTSSHNNTTHNKGMSPQNKHTTGEFQKLDSLADKEVTVREQANSEFKRKVAAIVKRQLTDADFKSLYIQKLSDDIKQKLELSDAKNIPIQKLSEIVKRELETNFKNQYVAKLTDIVRSELEEDLKNLNSHPENVLSSVPRDMKTKRKIEATQENQTDFSKNDYKGLSKAELAKSVEDCFKDYMVDASIQAFIPKKSMHSILRSDPIIPGMQLSLTAAENSLPRPLVTNSLNRSKRFYQTDLNDLQENENTRNLEESLYVESPAINTDELREGASSYDGFNEDGPAQLKIQIEYSTGSLDRNSTKEEACAVKTVDKCFTEANASKGNIKQRQVQTKIIRKDQIGPCQLISPFEQGSSVNNHGLMIKREEDTNNQETKQKMSKVKQVIHEPVCELDKNVKNSKTKQGAKDLASEHCGITGDISNSALNELLISFAEKYIKNSDNNHILGEECFEASESSSNEDHNAVSCIRSPNLRHLLAIDSDDWLSAEDQFVPVLREADGIDWVKALQPHASIRKRDLSTDPLNFYNLTHNESEDGAGTEFCPAESEDGGGTEFCPTESEDEAWTEFFPDEFEDGGGTEFYPAESEDGAGTEFCPDEFEDGAGTEFCPTSDPINTPGIRIEMSVKVNNNNCEDVKNKSEHQDLVLVPKVMNKDMQNISDQVPTDICIEASQLHAMQNKTSSETNINKLNGEDESVKRELLTDLVGKAMCQENRDFLPTKLLQKRDLEEDLLYSFGGMSDPDEGKISNVQKKMLDQPPMEYFESEHDDSKEKRSIEDEQAPDDQLTDVELLLRNKKKSWADVTGEDEEADIRPGFETRAGFDPNGKYLSPILASNIGHMKRRLRRSERNREGSAHRKKLGHPQQARHHKRG